MWMNNLLKVITRRKVSPPGFEPATYRSRSRHANHSATASQGNNISTRACALARPSVVPSPRCPNIDYTFRYCSNTQFFFTFYFLLNRNYRPTCPLFLNPVWTWTTLNTLNLFGTWVCVSLNCRRKYWCHISGLIPCDYHKVYFFHFIVVYNCFYCISLD